VNPQTGKNGAMSTQRERTRIELVSWIVGASAVVLLGVTLFLGFVVTGPDEVQDEYVRLIYVHPATAWVAYLAFGVTSLMGLLWLWPRTRRPDFDHLAGASAEIGVMFTGLTLVLGSIWGRPTWGGWWVWDARVTSTLVLFLLYLGVAAIRRVPSDPDTRARRTAIASLIAFVQVPVTHLSVQWWDTLHQDPSVLKADITNPEITGVQLVALLISFVAFSLVYSWLLIRRSRLERWRSEMATTGLDAALVARRAEGAARPSAGAAASSTVR
jgi:heme exporter protein C